MSKTRLLLEEGGVDVDILTLSDVRSPVFVAAEAGRTEMVELLRGEFGADLDLRDGEGRTPLWIAAKMDHGETVGKLIEMGKGFFLSAMNLNVVVGVVVVVVVVVATATAAVLLLVAFVVPAAPIFVFVFVAAAAAAVDVATFIFRKVYYVQNFSTFW